MIHEEICTYEVCKLAEEKGFNVPTSTIKVEKIEGTEKEVWDEEECRYITQWEIRSLRIPTQSLLQRWLREEKNIHISVEYEWVSEIAEWIFNVHIKKIKKEEGIDKMTMSCYSTYELALENLV